MKKIHIILLTMMLFGSLPASAVKWVDSGVLQGINTGVLVDIDSISDTGNQVSLVLKSQSTKMLQNMTYSNKNQHPLSMCFFQAMINCSTELPISGATLCYDKSGNVAIDEVYSNSDIKNYDYSDFENLNCHTLRTFKKNLK